VIHCFLADLRYIQIYVNNNMFKKKTLIVAVYVDDILLCKLNKNKILDLKIKLNNHFEMTNCEICKHYLKMLITQNKTLQIFILS